MIQIKEAYRLLRRNKRVLLRLLRFFLLKITIILLHIIIRSFACLSNSLSVLRRAEFVGFFCHLTSIVYSLLYWYFVGEEERVEISNLSMILIEFEDFLISDLDDAFVINMVQRGKCEIHPNHTIPFFDRCYM